MNREELAARIAQLEAEVGDLRGDLETREALIENDKRALQRIAAMPTVERNPDGVDQAAASMQLVAQAALTRAEGRDAG